MLIKPPMTPSPKGTPGFINILYYAPVGMLLQMDKAHLRHSHAKAKLVCHWLEGILELMTKLELEGK